MLAGFTDQTAASVFLAAPGGVVSVSSSVSRPRASARPAQVAAIETGRDLALATV